MSSPCRITARCPNPTETRWPVPAWKPLVLVLFSSVLAEASDVAPPREAGVLTLGQIAGKYYQGNGLGVNCYLTIKPEGVFSFEWRGCLGLYEQGSGGAKLAGGHLILSPERAVNI